MCWIIILCTGQNSVLPSTEASSALSLLRSASYSCAIEAVFVKILIFHSPNCLRAVTDNLQRLVGVLTAEAEENVL